MFSSTLYFFIFSPFLSVAPITKLKSWHHEEVHTGTELTKKMIQNVLDEPWTLYSNSKYEKPHIQYVLKNLKLAVGGRLNNNNITFLQLSLALRFPLSSLARPMAYYILHLIHMVVDNFVFWGN